MFQWFKDVKKTKTYRIIGIISWSVFIIYEIVYVIRVYYFQSE